MRHVRVIVRGSVQGVGFRFATRAEAVRLGVAGWVRNRRDGTVEVELHGEEGRVQTLLDWLAQGPPAARVTGVEVTATDARGPLTFDVHDDA